MIERLTVKKVNAEIQKAFPGKDIELVSDGKNMFWYAGKDTVGWHSTRAEIYTLNQYRIQDFINEITELSERG